MKETQISLRCTKCGHSWEGHFDGEKGEKIICPYCHENIGVLDAHEYRKKDFW